MSQNACFLCFALGRRCYEIINTYLQEFYEKITDIKISDSHPLCYICHWKLQQCHQLVQLSQQTQGLLKSFLENTEIIYSELSLVALSRTKVVSFSTPTNDVVIKQEMVKEEIAEEEYDSDGTKIYEVSQNILEEVANNSNSTASTLINARPANCMNLINRNNDIGLTLNENNEPETYSVTKDASSSENDFDDELCQANSENDFQTRLSDDSTMETTKLQKKSEPLSNLECSFMSSQNINSLNNRSVSKQSDTSTVRRKSLQRKAKNQIVLQHDSVDDSKQSNNYNQTGPIVYIKSKTKVRTRDYCLYCKIFVLNFARHLMRHHWYKPEVQKIISKPKKSVERKIVITALRKKWNYIQNSVQVVKPMRKNCLTTRYAPCDNCLGFYSAKFLWKHKRKCTGRFSRKAQAEGQNLLIRHLEIDEKLKEDVFLRMRADKISLVAKSDALICAFGSHYLKTNRTKNVIYTVSRKMRELGKLLIELKKSDTKIKTLLDALKPAHYDALVQATKVVGGYNAETNQFETPSYAINLSTNLRRCCNIGVELKKGDLSTEAAAEVNDIKALIKIMNTRWRDDVSSLATLDYYDKTCTVIPLAKDHISDDTEDISRKDSSDTHLENSQASVEGVTNNSNSSASTINCETENINSTNRNNVKETIDGKNKPKTHLVTEDASNSESDFDVGLCEENSEKVIQTRVSHDSFVEKKTKKSESSSDLECSFITKNHRNSSNNTNVSPSDATKERKKIVQREAKNQINNVQYNLDTDNQNSNNSQTDPVTKIKSIKKVRTRDYCPYCKNSVLNFTRHLLRHHKHEPEVQKIISIPKQSVERKHVITALRKKGNYLQNLVQVVKPMRKHCLTSSYLPCDNCLGFYSANHLRKHKNKCTGRSSRNVQAEAQNLISNLNIDEKLKEAVFLRMRADKISLVAKSDALICAFGSHYLKTNITKNVINTVSRKMRELGKLLIELKKSDTKIKTLLDALKPAHYDALVQATKVVSGYKAKTNQFETSSYAINLSAKLRQCCNIAETDKLVSPSFVSSMYLTLKKCCNVAVELKKPDLSTEAAATVEDIKALIQIIDSRWKNDVLSNANKASNINSLETSESTHNEQKISTHNMGQSVHAKTSDPNDQVVNKKRCLVPWTTEQKKIVTTFFKHHIKNRKPPKRDECDALKEKYPEILNNKDWLKIKVFIQNAYTKKS